MDRCAVSLTPHQQELIRDLAELLAADGFALAGAGGLIDSGIIDRPTRDIDLFTNLSVDLLAVIDRMVDGLRASGRVVEVHQSTEHFGRLTVDGVEVDLGRNWRAADAVVSALGPRLSTEDLVAGKMSALASRLENRDVVDVARLAEQFDFAEMVSWAMKADDGFDLAMVADMVRQQRFRPQGRFDEPDFAAARTAVLEAIERLLTGDHP